MTVLFASLTKLAAHRAIRPGLSVMALLLTCSGAHNARAAGPANGPVANGPSAEVADALFRSARALLKDGKVVEACQKFHESYRLDSGRGTLLNIGECEEQLGHLSQALLAFRTAKDRLPSADDRLAFVDEKILALATRVPRIQITLPDAPAHALVQLDSLELAAAAWSVPVPVDPGAHHLRASAPGFADSTSDVTLAEGQTLQVALPLTRLIRPDPQRQPHPLTLQGRKTAGYVTIGGGALFLGVGTVAGIALLNAASTFRAHCNIESRICADAEGESARSTGAVTQWLAPIALGLGAVATGVGVYLLITSKPHGASLAAAGGPSHVSLTGTF